MADSTSNGPGATGALAAPRRGGAVVAASGVNHYFGEGESRNQVLFDNTIEIGSGELVIMTGPSGSGKTTLLTLVGALRGLQEGSLTVLGHDMAGLDAAGLVAVRRGIGFIFQMHNLFESLTALENVRMAAQLAGTPPEEAKRQGREILKRLGLGHRIEYKPKALSGGQRQRVAVARALVNRPPLILADEPTAALDKASTKEVVALLKELANENGSSIMMVTHDNRILEAADRIVNMVDGRVSSDVMVREAVVICQFLKSIDLFASLGANELTGVAEKMHARAFAPGETLIRQGDVGEDFFLIRDGAVDVVVAHDGREDRVATLGPGDSFGERALLTGETRSASIVAKEAGTVYALNKESFDAALKNSPSFHEQILQLYFQRQ
jgi:putative ABC transport system ATP-binding protein